MMTETQEARLKRMKMRSMRRGIKEMDIILNRFAQTQIEDLSEGDLDLYDDLLSENDHDLYQWVTGQTPAFAKYSDLIVRITASIPVG